MIAGLKLGPLSRRESRMLVLLLKDVAGIGHAGDIKDVSGGHAKNYLFPKKLAVEPAKGAQSRRSL
jgi:ribosomal protein L9